VLHINRAACNIELSIHFHSCLGSILNDRTENYGKVLRDCSAAIMVNVRSSKAYYRSALALVALERYDEAVDSCSRCLSFDPTNQSVSSLKEKAGKLHDAKVKKEQEKQERLRVVEEERRRLQIAFKVRDFVNPMFAQLTRCGRKGTSSWCPIPTGRRGWTTILTSTKKTPIKAP